jgi:phage/plasmid-associated DNA primase
MYIKGAPSTGKTTLLVKIIYNFFGEENIGTISGNSNFGLEGLLHKELAVIDEAEHLKINTGSLLKITESYNPQSVDRKYKKASLLSKLNIIFLSNNEIEIEDDIVREAFRKRIQLFEFKKCLPESTKFYIKLIKSIVTEEIDIIIYCNKLFFKHYIYKEEVKKPNLRNGKLLKKLLESR